MKQFVLFGVIFSLLTCFFGALGHAEELPLYTTADVAKHQTKASGIWVSYQGYVYDISQFVAAHPGGQKILQAAGGPLEPHWTLYPVHLAQHVQALLSQYKIGRLQGGQPMPKAQEVFPFANEPQRSGELQVLSAKPFNAETPIDALAKHHLTPNAQFYTRNHLPVPKVDVLNYRLEIWEEDKKVTQYSLADLAKQFQSHEIVVTLQCAGNRRAEMSQHQAVKGLNWKLGAISTAAWKGWYLADIINAHNAKGTQWAHVQFVGMDNNEEGGYGASISWLHASTLQNEVLLAYEMNHERLPLDHGFPLRVIVPGVVGARQVKWLKKIVFSQHESPSFWQQQDYKIYPKGAKNQASLAKTTAPIQDMPVQSVILTPQSQAKINIRSPWHIEGYAWSGGGRSIARVEVSLDGGKHWQLADMDPPFVQRDSQAWAWIKWKLNVGAFAVQPGSIEVMVRAMDSSQNSQPQSVESIWNERGLVNNAWHRISLELLDS